MVNERRLIIALTAIFIILLVTTVLFGSIKMQLIIAGICILIIFSTLILQNIQKGLLLIAFTIPLSISYYIGDSGIKLGIPGEYGTLLIFLGAFFLFIAKRPTNYNFVTHPLTLLILCDLLVTFISTLFSSTPLISTKRMVIKTVFVPVYYLLMSGNRVSLINKKRLLMLYVLGLLIPVLFTLVNHMPFGFSVQRSYDVSQPFFPDHTMYGACIAFVLPFMLLWTTTNKDKYEWSKLTKSALTLLFIIAVFFSYSRAAWLSLAVCLGFYIALRLKLNSIHFVALSLVALAVITFKAQSLFHQMKSERKIHEVEVSVAGHVESITDLNSNVSNLERINRWDCALKMFKKHPIVGFGPGSYPSQYGQFQSQEYITRISTFDGTKGNAHSEYLGALSETGFLGLLALLFIILYSVHLGIVNFHYYPPNSVEYLLIWGALGGLITFYIHSMFNSFLDSEKMAFLVYGSLGIITCLDIERRKSNQKIT